MSDVKENADWESPEAFDEHIKRLLANFITTTVNAWKAGGIITTNSFGVVIGTANDESLDKNRYTLGVVDEAGNHDGEWYIANAIGKAKLCALAEMDSLTAIHLYPMFAADEDGFFPWGGGIYDKVTGIVVAVSGFDEDEDILLARTIFNWMLMMLNREGKRNLDAAKQRGEEGDGIDRFTRELG